jgi:8-oxo-dGTP pyrophosphatase MutT (NUDIX family)
MQKPQVVARKPAHNGRVIEVSTERLRFSDGREYDTDYVKHPGAAAVVAVDDGGRVCLVRQYRHGVDDFLWEVPAGKLDPGERPEVCAVRELQEETGVEAGRWTPLGLYIPAPSIFTELIHLYLARDLKVGDSNPDADEELEIQWLPLQKAIDNVLSGNWNDGKTAMALVRAQHQLQM